MAYHKGEKPRKPRGYWSKRNRTAGERKKMERYGLSLAEVRDLMSINNCEICGIEIEDIRLGATKKCIDHCHATGDIRGVLCSECNQGLGKFKDSIKLLQNAIYYINQ